MNSPRSRSTLFTRFTLFPTPSFPCLEALCLIILASGKTISNLTIINRAGLILFTSVLTVGQFLFALGGAKVSYGLMLTGRGIFGLGGECMSVAQSSIISQWFKGQELSFAFGITLCVARVGSYINGKALPAVAELFPADEPVKQVSWGLFLGFAVCVMSWVMAICLATIDAWADKVEGKSGIQLTEEEKFHLKDIGKFEKPYWLLVLSCVLVYCVIFPYLSNIGIVMLEGKYGYTKKEAGSTCFLPYLISAFLCAPVGYLIDKVGKRAIFSKYLFFVVIVNSFTSHGIVLRGDSRNDNHDVTEGKPRY